MKSRCQQRPEKNNVVASDIRGRQGRSSIGRTQTGGDHRMALDWSLNNHKAAVTMHAIVTV
jgi:hypothetical protein